MKVTLLLVVHRIHTVYIYTKRCCSAIAKKGKENLYPLEKLNRQANRLYKSLYNTNKFDTLALIFV